MKIFIISILTIFVLTGCLPPKIVIEGAIDEYEKVADSVELGDSKQKFLSEIYFTQEKIDSKYRKRPEKFLKNNIKVEIYYIRSSIQPDGLTTDDEFIPYVFENNSLVAIGWASLGGPKTAGQAVSDTYITNTNTNTTNVTID